MDKKSVVKANGTQVVDGFHEDRQEVTSQIQIIEISEITLDQAIQSRVELSKQVIEDYSENMAAGADFPPVSIFDDGDKLWLSDGFHRICASEKAGKEAISAKVQPGTRRDAILFSVGVNATHGLRRTNADKRKAVQKLLGDPEWMTWSDGVISSNCGVSQPFVSKLRHETTDNGYESPDIRKGADGRNYRITSNQETPSSRDTAENQDAMNEDNENEDNENVEDNQALNESSEGEEEDTPDEDNSCVEDQRPSSDDSEDSTEPVAQIADRDSSPEEEEADTSNDSEPAPTIAEGDVGQPEGTDEVSEESNSAPSETMPENVSHPVSDDVDALRTEITCLNKELIEKDKRIEELESEMTDLRTKLSTYEG